METGKWTALNQLLEEERNFFHDVIKGIGISYHSILTAYDHVGPLGYRSRGYGEARELFELFSALPEEQYGEFLEASNEEREKLGYLKEESGHFPRLVKLTAAAREYIPAMDAELEIMERLRKTYLEPMRVLIYKTVPERIEEHEGRLFLFPEEVVKLVEGASAIRAYWDYRTGLSDLRLGYFADGVPVEDLVVKYIPTLDAFGYKWNNRWDLGAGDNAIDQFGFINLCIMDAHSGSVVADALESDKPDEVLLNDVPRKGIDKVIFRPGRGRLRSKMRGHFRDGSHKDNECIPSMIRNRSSLGKYLKYVRRLKKDLRKKGVRLESNRNKLVV